MPSLLLHADPSDEGKERISFLKSEQNLKNPFEVFILLIY